MMKLPSSPHLDGLVDLACRDGVDIRPTLLRVLTDLYVQKPSHSADEETQYVELALGLIDSVDAPTRAAVAASLAKYPAAPAAVLHKLGGGEVSAEPATGDPIEQFFAATPDQRRAILATLDAAAAPPRAPAPPAGELIRRLETAALQHNAGEFGRVLERALSVSAALAERVTRDPSGEPIVIAAKALGMSAAVLQRVLLFLNPAIGQSVERVHILARLFDDLAPETAARMVELWRKSATGRKSPPAHEPVHWDDERRSARSLATSTVRRRVSRTTTCPRAAATTANVRD
jgi:uncharacterized protein (DUF2336 family)